MHSAEDEPGGVQYSAGLEHPHELRNHVDRRRGVSAFSPRLRWLPWHTSSWSNRGFVPSRGFALRAVAPKRDHRQVEGVIYRYRCGIAWRDLPAEFGPWQTVRKRHRRFCADGTWDKVMVQWVQSAGRRRTANITR